MSDEVLENHFPFIRPVRHVVLVLKDVHEVRLTAPKKHRTSQNKRVDTDWQPAEGIFITLRGPEPFNSLIKCLCWLFESHNLGSRLPGFTTHIKTKTALIQI